MKNPATWLFAALLAVFAAGDAAALPMKEFRKFSREEQSMFIVAAVGMAAYTYASTGEPEKARCIWHWFFGKPGAKKTAPGPRKIVLEMVLAEHADDEKYHVEGVILGMMDKACGAPEQSSPKPEPPAGKPPPAQ